MAFVGTDRQLQTVDLSIIKSLGIPNATKENIKWIGPIVYLDVLPDPVKYTVPEEYGILGILALGTLQLPEIGDAGSKELESGAVAYYLASDPVVYRSCGGGRGILFQIRI